MNKFIKNLIDTFKTEELRTELIAVGDVVTIINRKAEKYNNGWIPCSERLPETFEDTKSSDVVLICGYDKRNDYYWQAMGFYVKSESIKRWFFADCKNTDKPIDWIDIIAWQPLPEPYKES